MFLKHGAKKVNEIELVAPTGFEPVFGRGHVFARFSTRLEFEGAGKTVRR